jgi:MFS family permease
MPQQERVALIEGSERAAESSDGRHIQRELLTLAVVLSTAAGVVHLAVMPAHFREFWLFGAFFLVVALLQLLWGALVAWRASRRLLLAGVVGNAAIVLLWALSRSVGLPVGPEPWTPEGVGLLDVLSTLYELAVVALAFLVARRQGDEDVLRPSMQSAPVIVATGVVAAVTYMTAVPATGMHM